MGGPARARFQVAQRHGAVGCSAAAGERSGIRAASMAPALSSAAMAGNGTLTNFTDRESSRCPANRAAGRYGCSWVR